jgi:hypothetical protein
MTTEEEMKVLVNPSMANYMLGEIVALIEMAAEHNFKHLRYLLEIAALEANRLQNRTYSGRGERRSASAAG